MIQIFSISSAIMGVRVSLCGTRFLCLCVLVLFFTAHVREVGASTSVVEVISLEDVTVHPPERGANIISSVSRIGEGELKTLSYGTLTEAFNYAPGAYVTLGRKGEAQLRLRGLDSQRITLLYDGIPLYEPFFNGIDLNTIPAAGVRSIELIKGPGSALYGPDSMGGVVSIRTDKPNTNRLTLSASGGGNQTWKGQAEGTYAEATSGADASIVRQESDGFDWKNEGSRERRENSQYRRTDFDFAGRWTPTTSSTWDGRIMWTDAKFGIPPATDYSKPRYWRFKEWERQVVGLGGATFFNSDVELEGRAYYIRHMNVLDAYTSDAYTNLQWESTYKNHTLGAFAVADAPITRGNRLAVRLDIRDDQVKTQDDAGEAWQDHNQQRLFLGVEDTQRLLHSLNLVAGLGGQILLKDSGNDESSLDPFLGLNWMPDESITCHVSAARKSRFPSMRSLYGNQTGNPNLEEEKAYTYELGCTATGWLQFQGSAFYSRYEDLIQTVRNVEGFNSVENVGKAHIGGFELSASRQLELTAFRIGYTYLDAWNEEENRRLDLVPSSELSLYGAVEPWTGFSLACWGLAVSDVETLIGNDEVTAAGYFTVGAEIAKKVGTARFFLRADNLFDKQYETEPGFPMPARTLSAGAQIVF